MADVFQTFPLTFQSGATGNGNGTAVNCGGLPFIMVQVTGLGVATINFEGTTETATFNNPVAMEGYNASNGAVTTTVTANGLYLIPTGGISQLRCRISGYSSGTITVSGIGTTTGTVPTKPPYADRSSGVLHRSAITTAQLDKLSNTGSLTVTAVTEAGSVLTNVARNVAVSAFNRWGQTVVSTGSVTPTANQAVRIAFAQVTNADGYDIFLSTAANPLWVGRITESQRAAGGIISSVGVYSAGGAANSIDVGIDGTGIASNANPFTSNNAYTPQLVTPVNCSGYSRARVLFKIAKGTTSWTGAGSLPTINFVMFFANQQSPSDFHQRGAIVTPTLLTAVGACLEQDFEVDVDGSTGLVVLIDSFTAGAGDSCSVWVELA